MGDCARLNFHPRRNTGYPAPIKQSMNRHSFIILVMLGVSSLGRVLAQDKFTISGYVRDAASGETLIGANISLVDQPGVGAVANTYGFFSLRVSAGRHILAASYLGYQDWRQDMDVQGDMRLNIDLRSGIDLQIVEVLAEDSERNVRGVEMGRIDMPMDNVRKLPALLGEIDILKALQLLPGVLSAGEGNAGFYVRGGGPDQNLVLLDEAVVYNSGHLLGFFSVFNSDAIKNTTLIKGGMPANYGGRLSSVVDVQMKEGNNRRFMAEGGVGAVASRLTVQGPIRKEYSSFILSARRTYALDLAQPFIRNTAFAGSNYYFYDLNAKINYRFDDRNRLYLSGYLGRDVLILANPQRDFSFRIPYGNATATLRWNHLFNDKLFLNVSAIYNEYDFSFSGGQDDIAFRVFSGVKNWNGKVDFDYFPAPNHNLKFGAHYTWHALSPNIGSAAFGDQLFRNALDTRYGHESALYVLDEWRLGNRLGVNTGLRLSSFTQVGPYTSKLDGREYRAGEPVVTYWGLEPRFSARYTLSPASSLKGGIALTNQYVHLVSNSTTTLPGDVWVPSTELVRPQFGVQYALGYFRNFRDNAYESSIEVYYRDFNNQIDYGESYVNNIAEDLEDQFVFGRGRSYGLELFLKKARGRLNGWIGYTLGRTERTFSDIDEGRTFPAIHDRRHDLSVVANFQLSRKWELGGVLVYGSGNAFTPVQSLYFIDANVVQEFGRRNSARLEDYHRLDFSATFTPKPDSRKAFTSFWTFSVYNTYNRLNPFFIYYSFDTDREAGTARATAYKVSLFPVIPSVTWNFRWNP
jgi:hypothetical protein